LGGADDRELWRLMRVVLADACLEGGFRSGYRASGVLDCYPLGKNEDTFLRDKCFQRAGYLCKLREDIGLDVKEKRAVGVGLGRDIFTTTDPAQGVGAKFGAVVEINIWW
jgi:hypothetical protein